MIHSATMKGYAGVGLIDIMPGDGGTLETITKVVVGIVSIIPTVKPIFKQLLSIFKRKKKNVQAQ